MGTFIPYLGPHLNYLLVYKYDSCVLLSLRINITYSPLPRLRLCAFHSDFIPSPPLVPSRPDSDFASVCSLSPASHGPGQCATVLVVNLPARLDLFDLPRGTSGLLGACS